MRILLTGAGGFIGRAFLRAYGRDWDMVALTRASDLASVSGATVVRAPEPGAPLPYDLASGFDVTIHLAGNSSHGLAAAAPWEDLQATGVFAASILGRVPMRRLIVLSSAAVYAGYDGAVDPSICPRPRMAYALSKLYVEGLAETLAVEGKIDGALIIRLYNAFGPGERPSRLIPQIADAVRRDQPFVLSGDPSSLSDPVHSDDVVRVLAAAISSDVRGTYDLCGGDPVPLDRQVPRVARVLGRQSPRIEVSPRAGEVPIRFYSDPKPLCAALGLDAPADFEAGVQRYARAAGWL